jgi:Tfp pilus assembly protein PilP
MKPALMLLAILLLLGCGNGQRDKLTADLAASGFEAAKAIEQGADPAKPLHPIKAAFAAIIYAHGYDYTPAAEYLKALLDQPTETKP